MNFERVWAPNQIVTGATVHKGFNVPIQFYFWQHFASQNIHQNDCIIHFDDSNIYYIDHSPKQWQDSFIDVTNHNNSPQPSFYFKPTVSDKTRLG